LLRYQFLSYCKIQGQHTALFIFKFYITCHFVQYHFVRSPIESIHREACSQRKNACDDTSIDNHSRSPKIVYMWAAIYKPLWIVGSAIGSG